MLTIFTIPKPFIGLDNIHQRNAIQSWLAIRPECEIILCGNDQGVAEVAKEYKVAHIPDIAVNEFGTPYINDAFDRAQKLANNDFVCYVNADIIFFDDFLVTFDHIPFNEYLVVGSRWDVDVDDFVDFNTPYSINSFRNAVLSKACLKHQLGSDYFIFKKHSLGELPAFVIGRPYWDYWMIYNARAKHLPVIDASRSIMDVHQNHRYGHVSGRIGDTWYGPEADANNAYVGEEKRFTLWDCTHLIDENYSISKTEGDRYLSRKIKTMSILKPRTGLYKKWQEFIQKFLMFLYFRREKIPYRLFESAVNLFYHLA